MRLDDRPAAPHAVIDNRRAAPVPLAGQLAAVIATADG
jgi:hypothetical protein